MKATRRSLLSPVILMAGLLLSPAYAAEQKAMPKEDVVEVPAIGPGLCVANVFQSNMVLQRDKPLNIWGWAAPGEEVVLAFAGQEVRERAKNRVATPYTMTLPNIQAPSCRRSGRRARTRVVAPAPRAKAERRCPKPSGPICKMSRA